MLRAELRDFSNTAWLQLQGRFTGAYAEQTRALVLRCNTILLTLIVDLSQLTLVDAGGEDLLVWLARTGALFVANTPHSLHLCNRLHLPVLSGTASRPRGRSLRRHY